MKQERQTTPYVFMVRPHHFGSNPQTAASNTFQHAPEGEASAVRSNALREFDSMTSALRGAGIALMVFEDTDEPRKPDAVFPNNWASFHADGRVYLYPLEAEDRRTERRVDIVESLSADWGFHVHEIVDLSSLEADGLFLEGTGSMVLDRTNRVAYAALSSRTHMGALADFAQRADYEITAFESFDANGRLVYHTNVMMAIGERFAVICAESIGDLTKRAAVLERLAASGREIVEISIAQMRSFAGNLLELSTTAGEPVIALSRTAHDCLSDEQRERIAACGRLLPMSIDTIERVGGGGVRCMLAEVFLSREPGAVAI